MKNLTSIILGLLCLPFFMVAQEDDTNDYGMAELNYMYAKKDMEKKFEDAVKEHNKMYHAEDETYEADLFRIMTGEQAGAYVWAMSATYTELDNAPGEGEHGKHWREKVAPYIERYGAVHYMRYNEGLSNTDEEESPMISVWMMDIASGEYYRFKDFMKSAKAVFEKNDREIAVYNNQFGDGSLDVAIVWPLDGWAEFDDDSWSMKEEYNKMYGDNAWDDAMEEWKDFVESNNREVWKRID